MDEQQNVTRGFLFADLRGYTAFVETHGDAAGAALLRTYRELVRGAITPFAGAEIRTEGDSFYVTFPSASGAVGAALAIVAAAAEVTARDPSTSIAVGIGVHAGETQSTDEGPVGSAVNIAARLAARAGAGEVLVTETVRGLTRTSGAVRYVARGTPRLKGITEPVPVYAALPLADVPAAMGPPRRLSPTLAAGLIAAVVVAGLLVVGAYALATGGAEPSARATPSALGSLSPSVAPTATLQGTPSPPVTEAPRSLAHEDASRIDLVPGRYRAVDFRPAFEITVDDGWTFRSDSADSDYVHLQLSSRPTSGLTFLRIDKLPTDPCANNPPSAATGLGSFTTWLRTQPGLEVGADVARRFTSIGAIQIDVAAHDEGACDLANPPYVAIKPFESSGGCCTGFQLNVGEVASVYLFGSDVVVAVFAVAPTQGEADILIPKVDGVLQTIAIDQP